MDLIDGCLSPLYLGYSLYLDRLFNYAEERNCSVCSKEAGRNVEAQKPAVESCLSLETVGDFPNNGNQVVDDWLTG
eukprot:scaffold2205_cov183-Ochromonas_danica.AAC.16